MTAPAAPKRPGNRPGPAVQDRPVAKKAAAAPATKPAAKAEAAEQTSTKKGPSAKGLSCLCGCGQPTKTDAAKFIPGHDAKLKSILLKVERGELPKSEIPEATKPFLQRSPLSKAWHFPTESGNTPDEERYGKTYAERKEEIDAEKEKKKAANQARLAKLKAEKGSKVKSKVADEDEDEDGEEVPEEEEE